MAVPPAVLRMRSLLFSLSFFSMWSEVSFRGCVLSRAVVPCSLASSRWCLPVFVTAVAWCCPSATECILASLLLIAGFTRSPMSPMGMAALRLGADFAMHVLASGGSLIVIATLALRSHCCWAHQCFQAFCARIDALFSFLLLSLLWLSSGTRRRLCSRHLDRTAFVCLFLCACCSLPCSLWFFLLPTSDNQGFLL